MVQLTVGLANVDVAGLPPWNVHAQLVGLLLERSVKLMHCPSQIEVLLATKFATGIAEEQTARPQHEIKKKIMKEQTVNANHTANEKRQSALGAYL